MIGGVSSEIDTYSIGLGYSKLEENKFLVDFISIKKSFWVFFELVIVNFHQSSGISEETLFSCIQIWKSLPRLVDPSLSHHSSLHSLKDFILLCLSV